MNYYEILGVSETASSQEIKAAYRRLVKKYHPDLNLAEAAQQTIININSAYEVLSDADKRMRYDRRFQAIWEDSVEEDPREVYRREFIRKRQEKARTENEKKVNMEKRAFKLVRKAAYPILIFAVFLLADYYLLPADEFTEVTEQGWQRSKKRNLVSYMQTKNFVFNVPNELHVHYDYYGNPQPLRIYVTPILRNVKKVTVDEGNLAGTYTPHSSTYSPYIPLPVYYYCLLFLPSSAQRSMQSIIIYVM